MSIRRIVITGILALAAAGSAVAPVAMTAAPASAAPSHVVSYSFYHE